MYFKTALENFGREHDKYAKRKQEVAKDHTPAQDPMHFFGFEKSAGAMTDADKAWSESVRTLLADAIALGRRLDSTNFSRDPQVGSALELARQELRSDPVENNAFVAELLEIALDNATEIAASD